MYRIVKLVAVSFRLDSFLLTEGSILDPVMRYLGVTSLIINRGPDYRVGWGLTFL
jgi:hypothetical protein